MLLISWTAAGSCSRCRPQTPGTSPHPSHHDQIPHESQSCADATQRSSAACAIRPLLRNQGAGPEWKLSSWYKQASRITRTVRNSAVAVITMVTVIVGLMHSWWSPRGPRLRIKHPSTQDPRYARANYLGLFYIYILFLILFCIFSILSQILFFCTP